MKKFTDLLTFLVIICAAVVMAQVVRTHFVSQSSSQMPEVELIDDWESLAGTGRLLGPDDATLRVVEFSDFQCPFCAQVRPELKKLRQTYPDELAIVYRHLPLQSIHPHAFEAALAAECAAAQGHFEEYHNALFEQQDSIGARSWERYAEDAKVPDLLLFNRCVAERRFEDRVRQDLKDADRVGVESTPTFISDGKMSSGVHAVKLVSSWIGDSLGEQ